MSHYSTLQDYRFAADVSDIRGAKIYGEGGVELAKVQDVVFDHSTGDIRYLAAKYESRRVLVPLNRVFRSAVDEDSFSSDMTKADLDRLPEFNDKSVSSRDEWRDYEKRHRDIMASDKRWEKDYKENWEESPVLHAKDDVAHSITPAEVPAAGAAPARASDSGDYVPDLTPQRIAPVFGSAENTPDKLNMVPQAGNSRGPAAEYVSAGLGPKWNGFAERVRRDLHQLRGSCSHCKEDERAA